MQFRGTAWHWTSPQAIDTNNQTSVFWRSLSDRSNDWNIFVTTPTHYAGRLCDSIGTWPQQSFLVKFVKTNFPVQELRIRKLSSNANNTNHMPVYWYKTDLRVNDFYQVRSVDCNAFQLNENNAHGFKTFCDSLPTTCPRPLKETQLECMSENAKGVVDVQTLTYFCWELKHKNRREAKESVFCYWWKHCLNVFELSRAVESESRSRKEIQPEESES